MFSKSFQTKIDDANRIFIVTVDKLKAIRAEISDQITSNNSGIERLSSENSDLEAMSSHTTRQIDQIGKLL